MAEQCTCECGNKNPKTILLYACSGGANVAEASDAACRQLMGEGVGSMFCLAGIGAGIQQLVEQARNADLNLVVDGCPMDCARKVFEQAGLSNVRFLRVTDFGLVKKPKGTRATADEIQTIIEKIKLDLAASPGVCRDGGRA